MEFCGTKVGFFTDEFTFELGIQDAGEEHEMDRMAEGSLSWRDEREAMHVRTLTDFSRMARMVGGTVVAATGGVDFPGKMKVLCGSDMPSGSMSGVHGFGGVVISVLISMV